MLVKIVTFFLIGIAVLAMFGRLRFPGAAGRLGRRSQRGKLGAQRDKLPSKPEKCRSCGAYKVGRGPCPCGKA